MLSSLTGLQNQDAGLAVNDSSPSGAIGKATGYAAHASGDAGVALNLSSHGLTLARIVAALADSAAVDAPFSAAVGPDAVARSAEDMRPPYLPLDGIADVGRLAQAMQASRSTQDLAPNPFTAYSSDKLIAMVSDDQRHFYTADEVRAARSMLQARMQRMADDAGSAQARVAAATQPDTAQDAADDLARRARLP